MWKQYHKCIIHQKENGLCVKKIKIKIFDVYGPLGIKSGILYNPFQNSTSRHLVKPFSKRRKQKIMYNRSEALTPILRPLSSDFATGPSAIKSLNYSAEDLQNFRISICSKKSSGGAMEPQLSQHPYGVKNSSEI